MNIDYYSILGVDRDSSKEEISKAFKKLVILYHPDRNPGDMKNEEKFKIINEAYSTLSSENKRKLYDENFIQNRENEYEDYNQHEIEVSITHSESIIGVEKDIFYPSSDKIKCKLCDGTGSSIKRTMKCISCSGCGFIYSFITTIKKKECTSCHGKGEVPISICANCGGFGNVNLVKSIKIKIPPGIKDDDVLKVKVDKCTEIIMSVTVLDFDGNGWERKGDDVYLNKEISLEDAILGCAKTIVFPDQIEEVILIKPCDENLKSLVLKNRGIKFQNKKQSDAIINFTIKLPSMKSEKSDFLIKEFFKELKSINNK